VRLRTVAGDSWHSGERVTDAVALSATERQNEQAILPAMSALKDFECHASTSTFCLKQDRSTTGKEPSLLIWMPLALKRCMTLAH
jgi:hypothetical protein